MVRHEEGVELAGLEFPDQLLDMRKIEIGVGPRAGIAPRAGVNADRPHERAEPQLTFCHGPIPCWLWLARDRDEAAPRHRTRRRRLFCFFVGPNTTVIPGRAVARARNPYSRWWLWIPGPRPR